ncbi:MAG: MgtC/SapB family protein [Betaproteobacteria bacterium]|nr:MgtC/SapB family protein [Betaproteobacteria bacterium]
MLPDSIALILPRLAAAVLLGALIGLNRELKHKPAGLRTHALVALGAAVLTLLIGGTGSASEPVHYDALSRVIQGVITGIGFLGAGVILHSSEGKRVSGLTTAASIWLAACLGCACGTGAWAITACAFALIMMILILGGPLERWALRHFEPHPEERDL